ncbi:MAG: hypothetical protein RLZZ196_1488 [Bacteroidota bacterium]|jgi:hypothetical protein
MKATLSFDFDSDNYDKENFELMLKARSIFCFLEDFEGFMRSETKHPSSSITDEGIELMERWKSKYYELKHENEIYA